MVEYSLCAEYSADVIEVTKGIYAPKGTTIQEGPITLLVHPYFRPRAQPFQEKLAEFLASYEGSVLTFEGEGREWDRFFERTVHYVLEASPSTANRFFCKTQTPFGAAPLELSWSQIAEFVRTFGSNKINASGGIVKKDKFGCLGRTVHLLREEGLEIEYLDDLVIYA